MGLAVPDTEVDAVLVWVFDALAGADVGEGVPFKASFTALSISSSAVFSTVRSAFFLSLSFKLPNCADAGVESAVAPAKMAMPIAALNRVLVMIVP